VNEKLREVSGPLAELAGLAADSGPWFQVPDVDLVRLTAAARAAGHRWDAIAVACEHGPGRDIPAVIRQLYWFTPLAGPGLFGTTQRAARTLSGRDAGSYPPLTWPCSGCGQQITDLAACGRPVHAELGHAAGCARLACDQAADEALRRDWLPRLVLHSEDAIGPVQRHWLAGPIIDDCPRCGWHGYFHRHLVTVDGDWTRTVCEDCWADLNPGIAVTVKFFSASLPRGSGPFAVIRQRNRSDHTYPNHADPRPRPADDLAAVLGAHHETGRGGPRRRRCGHHRDQPRPGRADHGQAGRPPLAARGSPANLGRLRLPAMTTHRPPEPRGYPAGTERSAWARSTGERHPDGPFVTLIAVAVHLLPSRGPLQRL
jgi:hypothetical protein